MKKTLLLLLGLLSLPLFAACDTNSETPPETAKLTVVLDWVPNINHSGLYVALANGYFAAQGLDVEIVQPGDNYALQLVAAGQAEFGVSYQEEVTFARDQAIPVVSVAAVIQHNTSCFAAPASKGIHSVADFAGKKYGGWGGAVEEALLGYLAESENFAAPVEIINIGSSDFFAATESSVDFSWIFYGVTGIEAELRGVALDTIFLKDIDPAFDYYTPVLVAEESWLAANPDIVRRFLAAVSEGYQYADSHPEEAATILLAAAPELDADLVTTGQLWLSGQYTDDAAFWGEQQEAVWQDFGDWLYQRGLLTNPFDAESAFTNDYLPQ
jgi:ABC-type nitrate/sulfonate/bicarbonate transport system substrate-binding protein